MRKFLPAVIVITFMLPALTSASSSYTSAWSQELLASVNASTSIFLPVDNFLKCQVLPLFTQSSGGCQASPRKQITTSNTKPPNATANISGRALAAAAILASSTEPQPTTAPVSNPAPAVATPRAATIDTPVVETDSVTEAELNEKLQTLEARIANLKPTNTVIVQSSGGGYSVPSPIQDQLGYLAAAENNPQSINTSGNINGNVITGSAFYGDGSNLSGVVHSGGSSTFDSIKANSLSVNDATDTRSNLGLSYATQQDYDSYYKIAAWGDSMVDIGAKYMADDLPAYGLYQGGITGQTSSQIAARMLVSTSTHDYITIIWAGRNNINDPAQVEADIASMVNSLSEPKRYLVLSILNSNAEPAGSSNYNTIKGINNYLAATYAGHYLDIRTIIVNSYNPSIPQDVTDHSNDETPTSLRADSLHLNQAGNLIMATQVANYINSLPKDPSTKVASYQDFDKVLDLAPAFGTLSIAQGGSLKLGGHDIFTGSTTLSSFYFAGAGAGAVAANATGTDDVAIGLNALNTGEDNASVAVGTNALFSSSFGSQQNVAVGNNSLYFNTGGYANTAVGSASLLENTTGINNTAMGQNALSANTTGSDNIAIGQNSLDANISGTANIAIGGLNSATNAFGLVAIGDGALASDTSGDGVALGYNSLFSNISGHNDTAVGYNSLYNNTIGSSNVGFGDFTLGSNVSGNYNAAYGTYALSANTSGTGNTSLGYFSGFGDYGTPNQRSTVDSYMTFLGYQAARAGSVPSSTPLQNGTAIGYDAQVGCSNCMVLGGLGSDAVNIGIGTSTPSALLTIGDEASVNSSGDGYFAGNVGIGTPTPSSQLTISDNGADNTFVNIDNAANWRQDGLQFLNQGIIAKSIVYNPNSNALQIGSSGNEQLNIVGNDVGILTATPATPLDVDGYITEENVQNCSTLVTDANGKINCVASDERLKTNITPLDATDSLASLDELNPVSFNWVDPTRGTQEQFGFIAQQVGTVFPNLISTTTPTALTPGGTLTLDYLGLISPIVKAIQDIGNLAGTFQGNLIAWLGNTENGIQNIFANKVTTQESDTQISHTQTLCVGSTCVTEDQLKTLLQNAGQSSTTSTVSGGDSTTSSTTASTTTTSTPIDTSDTSTTTSSTATSTDSSNTTGTSTDTTTPSTPDTTDASSTQ